MGASDGRCTRAAGTHPPPYNYTMGWVTLSLCKTLWEPILVPVSICFVVITRYSSLLQFITAYYKGLQFITAYYSLLQFIATSHSLSQFI